MGIIDILFLALATAAMLTLLAGTEKHDEHKEQEKKDPCESCLRWSECNGVDDDCPLWKEVN
jgi:hypothetical protein